MRWFTPLLMLAAMGLSACTPHKPSPKADNFPVVVPFALDRAGSKVTVEFELPNALDPHLPEPTLRPVFIGVRRVEDKGGGDAELKEWIRRADYMRREAIPIRLMLERWDQGQWRAVVLHAQHDNIDRSTGNVWYEPIADDGVVSDLQRVTPDHMELIAVGKKQDDKAYDTFQLVRIVPPTPGRYRLQAESLQDHPAIGGLVFELLVSHHYHYGIR